LGYKHDEEEKDQDLNMVKEREVDVSKVGRDYFSFRRFSLFDTILFLSCSLPVPVPLLLLPFLSSFLSFLHSFIPSFHSTQR
jgi:hypothetical protein